VRDVGLNAGSRGGNGGAQLGQQGVQVHRLAAASELPGVGLREQQQLRGELLKPPGLPDGAAGDVRPRCRGGMRQPDFQARADRGHRGAELVGGISDETALPGSGVLQPGQHVVHGAGQVADLVVGAWLGNPPGQVGGGDGIGGTPDPLHRPQCTADDQPDGTARQRQQRWQADREQPDERLVDLVAQAGGRADDDGGRPSAGRHVLTEDGKVTRENAVGGLLPGRHGRAGGEPVERGQPRQAPGGGEHAAVRRQDLRLGGRVKRGAGQRPGEGSAGCGLLDLGGVNAQLALDGAVGGTGLDQVHHDQPEQHRHGERESGGNGDAGAYRAKARPASHSREGARQRAPAGGHVASSLMM
jgi:hypothetical protein